MSINAFNGLPMFDISAPSGESTPLVSSAVIAASDEPSKLQEGTLMIRSDLATACVSSYLGGPSNSELQAFALVSRSESSGDFTYATESGWTYTVAKECLLSGVRTQVTRMNGKAAILKPNSVVLYKITRSLQQPEPLEPPPKRAKKSSKR